MSSVLRITQIINSFTFSKSISLANVLTPLFLELVSIILDCRIFLVLELFYHASLHHHRKFDGPYLCQLFWQLAFFQRHMIRASKKVLNGARQDWELPYLFSRKQQQSFKKCPVVSCTLDSKMVSLLSLLISYYYERNSNPGSDQIIHARAFL